MMGMSMPIKNTTSRYGWMAKLLHWGSAVTIISMFALGLWMVELDYYSDWYTTAPHVHQSIGVLLCLAMIFRVVWRIVNPKPKAAPSLSRFEKLLAHIGHILIYIIIFFIIVTGYLIPTADGRVIEVFNWFNVPALGSLFERQEDVAGQWHLWASYALIALVVVHALAALRHHFVVKDDTLKKML